MSHNCRVPGCRQSYSSSASLRSHLSQASDHAHKKYHSDLYEALNFDVGASIAIGSTLPTEIVPPTGTVQQREQFIHNTIKALMPAGTAGDNNNPDGNGDDEDSDQDDPADFIFNKEASEAEETLDLVDDQANREIFVEEVEEDLDKVAEIMEEALNAFQLSLEEDLVDYLPTPIVPTEVQPTSNSLSRKLVEAPDSRFTSWHPTAGKVLSVDHTIQEHWKKLFDNQDNRNENYKPFSSQTDWELGQWAIKEKTKQGSFNQLLNLPGVSLHLIV